MKILSLLFLSSLSCFSASLVGVPISSTGGGGGGDVTKAGNNVFGGSNTFPYKTSVNISTNYTWNTNTVYVNLQGTTTVDDGVSIVNITSAAGVYHMKQLSPPIYTNASGVFFFNSGGTWAIYTNSTFGARIWVVVDSGFDNTPAGEPVATVVTEDNNGNVLADNIITFATNPVVVQFPAFSTLIATNGIQYLSATNDPPSGGVSSFNVRLQIGTAGRGYIKADRVANDAAYGRIEINTTHGGGAPTPSSTEWSHVSPGHIAFVPGDGGNGGHIQFGVAAQSTNLSAWSYRQYAGTPSSTQPLGFSSADTWRVHRFIGANAVDSYPGIFARTVSTNAPSGVYELVLFPELGVNDSFDTWNSSTPDFTHSLRIVGGNNFGIASGATFYGTNGFNFVQKSGAPSAATIGGSIGSVTNHMLINVGGGLIDYWSDGTTVYSKQIAP